jgi:hypothetical protein
VGGIVGLKRPTIDKSKIRNALSSGLSKFGLRAEASMITRRQFSATGLVGALAATVHDVGWAQQKRRRNTLMHVGGDYHSVLGADITSKQNLEYNLRHGVKHLTVEVKKGSWDIKELERAKDKATNTAACWKQYV